MTDSQSSSQGYEGTSSNLRSGAGGWEGTEEGLDGGIANLQEVHGEGEGLRTRCCTSRGVCGLSWTSADEVKIENKRKVETSEGKPAVDERGRSMGAAATT